MERYKSLSGMTLLELLVVIAVIATLLAFGVPSVFRLLISEHRVNQAVTELVSDIRFLQTDAISRGGGDIEGGKIVKQSVFMVFNIPGGSYQAWRYIDTDGDNIRDAGELTPVDVEKKLQNNVMFGITSEVAATACANAIHSAPSAFVSYQTDAAPPCNGNRCLQMDARGFPSTNDGAIYLTNGDYSYAVSINSAGVIRVCKWPKGGKGWIYVR